MDYHQKIASTTEPAPPTQIVLVVGDQLNGIGKSVPLLSAVPGGDDTLFPRTTESGEK